MALLSKINTTLESITLNEINSVSDEDITGKTHIVFHTMLAVMTQKIYQFVFTINLKDIDVIVEDVDITGIVSNEPNVYSHILPNADGINRIIVDVVNIPNTVYLTFIQAFDKNNKVVTVDSGNATHANACSIEIMTSKLITEGIHIDGYYTFRTIESIQS